MGKDSLVEKVKKMAWESVGKVVLPREGVIVNIRLGVLYKLMTLGIGFLAVYNIYMAINKEIDPDIMTVQFWREGGDYTAGPEPDHCAALDKFVYKYNSAWIYAPERCKTMVDGNDVTKTPNSIQFLTLYQESNYRNARGAACQDLEAACRAANRSNTYSDTSLPGANVNQRTCQCKAYLEYYARNQERTVLKFRHSYKVPDNFMSDSKEVGNSGQPSYQTGTKGNRALVAKKMLTILKRDDGEPCVINGRSEFLAPDDIGGSIEDWLACGDSSLDNTSTLTMSGDPAESGPPALRTTGVKVSLNMKYFNRHPRAKRDGVNAVCEITVRVLPSWQSRASTDLGAGQPANSIQGAQTQMRYRYYYGVLFVFEKEASFSFFNPESLIDGLVKAIVLFGVPKVVTRLIAMNGIGLVSTLYKKFLRYPFNIFHEIHMVSIALMFSAVGFRLWTQQFDTKVEVKEMDESKLEGMMLESFDMELTPDETGHCDIDEKEFKKCANIILMGINTHSDAGVQQDEYVHAATTGATAFGDSRLMLKFFDKKRKRNPIEKVLDPTRKDIHWANKECDERIARKASADPQGVRQCDTAAAVEDAGTAATVGAVGVAAGVGAVAAAIGSDTV